MFVNSFTEFSGGEWNYEGEEGTSRFPYGLTSSSRPFLAGSHPFPLFTLYNAIFPSSVGKLPPLCESRFLWFTLPASSPNPFRYSLGSPLPTPLVFSHCRSRRAALLLVNTKNRDIWPDSIFWACAEYSKRICQIYGKLVNPGLPILDLLIRGRNSWCWRKGAQALGKRMVNSELKSLLKSEIKALFSA